MIELPASITTFLGDDFDCGYRLTRDSLDDHYWTQQTPSVSELLERHVQLKAENDIEEIFMGYQNIFLFLV